MAGPPSPLYPEPPVPATVVITPVAASTRRTRLLPVGDEQVAGRVHRHAGWDYREALVAGPPSPP